MDRLASEWRRLYAASGDDPAALVDAQGHVRCMVLSLGRPCDWPLLQGVWQAVQAELGLPAPGIAVSGTDSYQLWFSLAKAVPATHARAFLTVLCERLLADVAPNRLAVWPEVDAAVAATPTVRHAAPIPAPTASHDQWSAFLAPDLAPVFADTPWLDLPPNADGQADLLARLNPVPTQLWHEALARWQTTAPMTDPVVASSSAAPWNAPGLEPRQFLRHVMHDPSVPLALRMDAAKALLAHEAPTPAPSPPCP